MHCLDLCCGSKSFAKACALVGLTCITVDNDPVTEPDFCVDITTWDYKRALTPREFDVVWASPPCTEYSRCMTSRPRDMETADKIVMKVLEIIGYLKPKHVFIENPATGLLPGRELITYLHKNKVSYCRYGMMYQKDTNIWSTMRIPDCLTCTPSAPCVIRLMTGRHTDTAQSKGKLNGIRIAYKVPMMLLVHVLHVVLQSEITHSLTLTRTHDTRCADPQ